MQGQAQQAGRKGTRWACQKARRIGMHSCAPLRCIMASFARVAAAAVRRVAALAGAGCPTTSLGCASTL